jgi:TM2 domain-containing membrane protein YozV
MGRAEPPPTPVRVAHTGISQLTAWRRARDNRCSSMTLRTRARGGGADAGGLIAVAVFHAGGDMDIEIQQVAVMKKELSNEERMQFDMQFAGQRKNPTTALLLGLFFGALGVDRFYIGDIGLGFGKLLTLGGLWVWQIIDWFLIMGATRQRNVSIAQQIRDTIMQTR